MDFYAETMSAIANSNHAPENIDWIGSSSWGWFTWDEFATLAHFDYDDGYGAQHVATDIVIHFDDGTCLIREEYDGAENWGFRPLLSRPETHRVPVRLGCGMWDTLAYLNSPEWEEDKL